MNAQVPEAAPDTAATPDGRGRTAYRGTDVHVQHEVEQFLYAEAELLDQHRFEEWVALFAEDVLYWMPTRMTRPIRERDLQVAALGESAFAEDDLTMLRGRIRQLTSGMSWSEEPPSRTRRLITNVRVRPRDGGELDVTSNFYVYRSRLERHEDWFVGERFDVLRPADREATGYPFVIADRKIVLEQATLLAPSISIFL
ncbi:3-phenylpropionate/cinnamic acid dioxygenase subunit beta [Actinomadura sp. NPDC000600]|uniref:aromatic-ring-hydroxylating dioxygenase subunit beta n=1 Tax=Actinomadura sp. NPDC000600 TaxID=3154262 RepID=UPI003392E9B1